jgi:hypothetical protein
MRVRNRLLPKSDYKGRPTEALDGLCPCRPCFHAHDCGRPEKVYNKAGLWITNRYPVDMKCVTRENNGCPQPIPGTEHVYTSDRARICKRCGQQREGRG